MKTSKKDTNSKFPSEIRLFSKVFKISYCDSISDVDRNKEDICFGQVNFRNNTIRVYKDENAQDTEVWYILFHEIYHIIKQSLYIDFEVDNEEKIIDNFAMATVHCLIENKINLSNLK